MQASISYLHIHKWLPFLIPAPISSACRVRALPPVPQSVATLIIVYPPYNTYIKSSHHMGSCTSLRPEQRQQPEQPREPKRQQDLHQTQKQELSAEQTLSQAAISKIPWRFFNELSHLRATNQSDLKNNRFEIKQPDLLCASHNRAVYVCLFKGCVEGENCLRCAKKDCPTCTKEHQYHGNKFHLEELTKQLRLRATEQKKILNRMEEVEAKLIDDIVTRKLTDFNKFNVAGLDESYGRVINAIYISKDRAQIKGMLLNDITYMLSEVNQKLAAYGDQLLKEFAREAKSLASRWQTLEKDIMDRLLSYPKVAARQTETDHKMQQLSTTVVSTVSQTDNPDNGQFKITPETKVKITYVGQDKKWCNFIKNGCILDHLKTKFSLQLDNTKDSAVLVGIATKKIYGLSGAFRTKQVVAYKCGDGYLYEGGVGNKRGRRVADGQTLTIAVDMIKHEIQWDCGEEVLARTVVPKHFLSEGLYLAVLMYNKEDTISLLPQ